MSLRLALPSIVEVRRVGTALQVTAGTVAVTQTAEERQECQRLASEISAASQSLLEQQGRAALRRSGSPPAAAATNPFEETDEHH